MLLRAAKHRGWSCIVLAVLLLWLADFSRATENYAAARKSMVRLIEQEAEEFTVTLDLAPLDKNVLTALAAVPRHEFVPEFAKPLAYENRPLPIGFGQTISQPYIVALMTDLLKVDHDDRVLEVGTGSGYQAAILAELVSEVYTIEIIEPLAVQARERLKRIGYKNITVRAGDGYYGWEDKAPFDAIVVTAAGTHIPPPLIRQLKNGGRMAIPVGSRFLIQQLLLVEKSSHGKVKTRQIIPVRFVPLTGDH